MGGPFYSLQNLLLDSFSKRIHFGRAANAAELMGWSDKVGELAAGKFADIIAVAGDPLQDITTLEHAKFVMKGAAVVKNDFAPGR